ncbi:Large cysteine-rich periplasmic protein OmcB precursor [Rosistilla carotiformis]|uniref:Large cysteine-rich periplasmic protein OmcB n=1 Tax=Rosistilla carotiformis TaxID=2528017 RepID=A0A518JXZ7_9BACT|nr:DUF11 domain-containing protein [Rosistilla carotiformis]QDV70413.1 Large cysteine-rich periplasmic protein OmcB precursor [Rosistilla carotiformis]
MSRFTKLSLVLIACLLSAAPASGQTAQSTANASAQNSNPTIRQVVGKQPRSRATSRQSSSQSSGVGILGRLFGGGSDSESSGTSSAPAPQLRTAARPTNNTSQPFPSPFIPTPSSSYDAGNSAPRTAAIPYVAPGQPQPLLDPEDRERLLEMQQQAKAAIPSAEDYDSSENLSVETYSAGSSSQGTSISVDTSFSNSSSSRRADRRTTFSSTESIAVDTSTRNSAPVSRTPSVPRKPLPGSSSQTEVAIEEEVIQEEVIQEETIELAMPAPAQPLEVAQSSPSDVQPTAPAPQPSATAQDSGQAQFEHDAQLTLQSTNEYTSRTTAPPSNRRSSTTRAVIGGAAATRTYQVPARTASAPTAATPAAAPPAEETEAVEVAVEPRDNNGQMMMSEIPMIRVRTHGPDEIQINQVAEYSIIVENKGAIDAPGVMIRASLPTWTAVRSHQSTAGDVEPEPHEEERRMLWQINTLPAGETETLTLRIAAERAETFDVGVEWTVLPQQRTAQVRVQEPLVKLVIEGPDEVVFGESRVYKVRVMNPGNGIANDVSFTLSPNSSTPQNQRIGTIPPGKEAQFEIELTAQDRGGLEIHGLASGANDIRNEAIKKIRVLTADLIATLTGPPLKYHNTLADYHLKINNAGTAASTDVVAVLRLPEGVVYKSGIQGAEVVGEFLRWKVDKMAPGASADYDIQCELSGVGSHVLAFECRGSAAGRATVSLTTKVEAIADLVLTINDPVAPAPVGEEVTYEIVIRNRGTRAAEEVKVIAQFSNGIEPIKVAGHAGELVPGQVLFDAIPRIDAGQEVTLSVRAKAMNAAHHRFRAEVTAGETILVAEEATRYMEVSTDRISRQSSSSASQR